MSDRRKSRRRNSFSAGSVSRKNNVSRNTLRRRSLSIVVGRGAGSVSSKVTRKADAIRPRGKSVSQTSRKIISVFTRDGIPRKVDEIASGNSRALLLGYQGQRKKLVLTSFGDLSNIDSIDDLQAVLHNSGRDADEIIINVDSTTDLSALEKVRAQVRNMGDDIASKVDFKRLAKAQQEVYTKSILGKIFDGLEDHIYLDDEDDEYLIDEKGMKRFIYSNLGTEAAGGQYNKEKIPDREFEDLHLKPQGKWTGYEFWRDHMADRTTYRRVEAGRKLMDQPGKDKVMNKYAYKTGDYFHVSNPGFKRKDTDFERIIVNLKSQATTLALSKFMRAQFVGVDRPEWSTGVQKWKFYAIDREKQSGFKHDKMVIYFNKDGDNRTREGMVGTINAFLENHGGETALDGNLSAFYESTQPGIGIAADIDEYKSFSEIRRDDVIRFISENLDLDRMDEADYRDEFIRDAHAYVKSRMTLIFDE